jgi:hypothetical protein
MFHHSHPTLLFRLAPPLCYCSHAMLRTAALATGAATLVRHVESSLSVPLPQARAPHRGRPRRTTRRHCQREAPPCGPTPPATGPPRRPILEHRTTLENIAGHSGSNLRHPYGSSPTSRTGRCPLPWRSPFGQSPVPVSPQIGPPPLLHALDVAAPPSRTAPHRESGHRHPLPWRHGRAPLSSPWAPAQTEPAQAVGPTGSRPRCNSTPWLFSNQFYFNNSISPKFIGN